MAEIEHFCGRCKEDNEETEGVVFCRDCEEPLCEQCKLDHGRIKVSKHHELCELADVPPRAIQDVLKRLGVCPKHEEQKVVFLCKVHDILCCGLCAMADHNNCKEVKVWKDIMQVIKSDCSGSKTALRDLQHEGESLLEHERKHEELISAVENKALSWFQTTKQKLLNICEELENEVMTSISDRKKVICEQIQAHTGNLHQYLQDIKQQSYLIEGVEKFGTNEQVVLLQRTLDRGSIVRLKKTASELDKNRSKSMFKCTVDTCSDSFLTGIRNCVRVEDLDCDERKEASIHTSILIQQFYHM